MNNLISWKVLKFDKKNKIVSTDEGIEKYRDAEANAINWSKSPDNGKAVIAIDKIKDNTFKAQVEKSNSKEFMNKLNSDKGYRISAFIDGKKSIDNMKDFQTVVDSIQQEVGKVQQDINNTSDSAEQNQQNNNQEVNQNQEQNKPEETSELAKPEEPVKPTAPKAEPIIVQNAQGQPIVKVRSMKAAVNAVKQANADNKANAVQGEDKKQVVDVKGNIIK